MTTKKRNLLLALAVLIIVIIAAWIYTYILLKDSVPQRSGKIICSSLQDSVQITFDAKGIPQIWAQKEADAYFAVGYLHASDRLFQMDMTRRVAQGRLADLLGKTVFYIDLHQRTVGHSRIAKKFLDKLSVKNKARLEAYTRGVNHYVQTATLPFEYILLGKDFDEWSVYDCLTILSFQTWFSDFLMSPDEFLVMVTDELESEKAQSLSLPYPVWAPKTVPQNKEIAAQDKSLGAQMVKQMFNGVDLPFRMSNSSNSWVVAPHKSESGRAIFASDPHLEIRSLPQFWYYLGIHIKENGQDVLGISTPGLPSIVMGHNGKTAWAFTVSGVDVNEYYQEKINPRDSTEYLTPSGWEKLEVFQEEIKISGVDKTYPLTVKVTRHGPLVFLNDSLKNFYALHWAGYDVDLAHALESGFNLMKADNFADFRRAVTGLGALDASWTYADADGNIGYQLGTPIAIRPKNSNNLPVPGWADEYAWQGFVPLDKTPYSYNPPRGWLAVCNNKPDETNLDYTLYGHYASDRIMRITELLQSKEKFSVKDMQNFQMDTKDAYLLRWKNIVAELLEQAGENKRAADVRKWDGSAGIDSKETALINLFINSLRHLTFDDELGERSKKLLHSDVEAIYLNGPYYWFDDVNTNEKETKQVIGQKALREALQMLGDKTWGDFHTLTMSHPLSVVPLLAGILELEHGPYPWAGTIGTLNASFYGEDEKNPGHFHSIVGPSWRFVIDFADPDAATMVLPSGVSGNPMSAHFMDFYEMWKNGGRWNVPFSYEKVKKRAKHILWLKAE